MLLLQQTKRYHSLLSFGAVMSLSLLICCNCTEFNTTLATEIASTFTVPCFNEDDQIRPLVGLRLGIGLTNDGSPKLITLLQNSDPSKYSLVADRTAVQVENAQIADAVEYGCESYDSTFISYNFYTTLSIYAPPRQVTVSTVSGSAIEENTTHTVTCEVPVVYPENSLQFSIVSGDQTLESAQSDSYSLLADGTFSATFSANIDFIRRYNTVKLKCRVDYDGPGNNDAELDSGPLSVSVQYCDPPTIHGQSGNDRNVGDSVTTTCIVNCFPRRDIKLYRGSSMISQGESPLATEHVLTRQDHQRQFVCDVDELGGGIGPSNTVRYRVLFYATSITLDESPSVNVPEGDDITMGCITNEANPTAIIEWSGTTATDISSIRPGNSEEAGTCCGDARKRKSAITFPARKEDNGGVVTCELQNDNNVKDSHTLAIKFEPTVIQMSTDTSTAVVVGNPKTVVCVSDSLHPVSSFVTMRWKRGDSAGSNRVPVYDDTQFTQTGGMYGGRIVTSTYTFNATREDNGDYVTCVPRWARESATVNLQNRQQRRMLTVYYPHQTVTVSNCGTVNEHTDCTLTCDATGGNPSTIDGYQWQFKRKFTDSFEDLNTDAESYGLSDISYRDAGVYKGTATNAGGPAEGTRIVLVNYAPIANPLDPGSADTMTFYAALGHDVTLLLAVHSHPTNARFTWSKDGSNRQDQTQPLDNDYTHSTVTIGSVGNDDYGAYTVTVTNGGGRSSVYTVVLEQRGKPGPVTDVRVESRSYRQIIFSFMPGLDGGSEQTIAAEIKADGARSFTNTGQPIVGPVQQVRYEVIAGGLQDSTTYGIQLISDNAHAAGSATVSNATMVTTRAIVKVKDSKLSAKVKGRDVILSWSQPEPDDFTALTIEQCRSKDTDCIDHNVTGMLEVRLDKENGTECTLMVMQDRDTAYSASFQLEEEGGGGGEDNPGQPLAVMIGAIVGFLILVGLIAGLVFVIILRKRRGGGENSKKDNSDAETPITAADDIMAVDPYAFENGAAPLRHTDNAGEEPNAPIYGKVDLSKKKKNRAQQPAGETGEASTAVYAQVDPRTKKNNRAPAGTAESNQTSNSAPKSNQPHRPAPPNPSTRPKIEAKPAPKAPAESPYTNVPQPDLGENPYSNVQDLQQGNPAPSEPGAYAPSEQGPYANVSYPPPAAPAADTTNLIYADLSFDRGQPGTAPKPQIIHGAEDTVEYSTVDFNRSAPAPQDSESEDEEDVNKRQ